MTTKTITCAECGQLLGGAGGPDPYKHTLNCFHLTDRGAQALRDSFAKDQSEYAKRIKANLAAVLGKE